MSKETPDSPTHLPRMRFAVSGASGFLGGVIAREAHLGGHQVMVWTQAASPPRFPASCARHETWRESAADLAAQIRAFRPDCIVHGAGSASVAGSISAPYADLQASLGTWSLLLEAVRLSGEYPLVIFPSSAAVYGNPAVLPVMEDAPRLPVSPYGMHKMLCEQLAASYHQHFGIPIVVLRLFSVFGPSQRRLLVRELFERCSSPTESLVVGGTGAETRDFLSEWCVASAVMAVAGLGAHPDNPASGRTLNLASGEERSVLEVAHCLRDLVCPGRPVSCRGETRPGDPARWHADISELRRIIPGWAPLPFRTAMERTVACWQAVPAQISPS